MDNEVAAALKRISKRLAEIDSRLDALDDAVRRGEQCDTAGRDVAPSSTRRFAELRRQREIQAAHAVPRTAEPFRPPPSGADIPQSKPVDRG
jgi:hypothetical protein